MSLPLLPPTATNGVADAPTHTMAGDGASVVVGANVVGRAVVGAAVGGHRGRRQTELGAVGTVLGAGVDDVVGPLGAATAAPAGPPARRSSTLARGVADGRTAGDRNHHRRRETGADGQQTYP